MFWKKKTKNTDENKKEILRKNGTYKIIIADKDGESSINKVVSFDAKLIRDELDGLLYLVNETMEFKAFFPSKRDNIIIENIEELKNKISLKEKEPVKETENPFNKLSELHVLKQKLYSLEHPSENFICGSEEGKREILYLRSNSNLIPLAYDINLNCIYIPSEPNLKDSLSSLVDKREKYKLKKDKLKGILEVAMWLIIVVLLLANLFCMYKIMKYDDSESSFAILKTKIDTATITCNQAMADVVTTNKETSNIMKENANKTGNLIDSLTEKLILPKEKPKEVKVE